HFAPGAAVPRTAADLHLLRVRGGPGRGQGHVAAGNVALDGDGALGARITRAVMGGVVLVPLVLLVPLVDEPGLRHVAVGAAVPGLTLDRYRLGIGVRLRGREG